MYCYKILTLFDVVKQTLGIILSLLRKAVVSSHGDLLIERVELE